MTVIPWLVESGSQSLGHGTHLQQASNRRFVGDSPSLQRDSADSAQRLDDMRGIPRFGLRHRACHGKLIIGHW